MFAIFFKEKYCLEFYICLYMLEKVQVPSVNFEIPTYIKM